MKMLYDAPEMEIMLLGDDVITASDGTVTMHSDGNTNSADNEAAWP